MKKIFLLLTLLLCTSMDWEYDVEVDGIYYFLNQSNKTAQVASYYDENIFTEDGDLCIPESISVEGTIYVVTSLGNWCFSGCTGLTSITIPNSVTSLGGGCFQNCARLESIEVESENTVYDSRENCNAIIETSSNTMIAGCKNTTIPNSVTSLGEWCFRECRGLANIKMKSSTPPSTGSGAFSDCLRLTTVYVPKGAKSAYNVSPWNRYDIVAQPTNPVGRVYGR